MPFEKSHTVGCEPRARLSLLLATLMIALSVLAATLAIRVSPSPEDGLVERVMESEAVIAFLGLEE